MRLVCLIALTWFCCAGLPHRAVGQNPAATNALRVIQSVDTGGPRSIDAINNSVLRASRAQVPRTGVNNFQLFAPAPSSGTRSSGSVTSFAPTISGSPSKPFANASNGSTISPYLNLFREDGFGGVDNYNTLVRPQLEQQRVNRDLQRRTQALNQRVQAISAQGAFNTRGSEQVMPTGHTTGFRYYSHYYPAFNRRR